MQSTVSISTSWACINTLTILSPWSILLYFWPALSDNWSWKPILGHFESGCFTQVLLYKHFLTAVRYTPNWYTCTSYIFCIIIQIESTWLKRGKFSNFSFSDFQFSFNHLQILSLSKFERYLTSQRFNHLLCMSTGKPYRGSFENSEDPDEM